MVRKMLLVAALLAAVVAFWALDLGQWLTPSRLKDSQAQLAALRDEHPVAFLAGYALLYVLVTAMSLPGATVLTLAGGAMLGLTVGTVVVSFASTIGATLACLAARYLLRDWVRARLGQRLQAIDEGMAREGAFYLFTLRLVPAFPFFLVNLAMGLTGMPWTTFYWVSQVGMLAGTVVYVNAGSELGRIDSLGGILSPGLIASLAALGVLPLAARKALGWYRARAERMRSG